MRDFYKDDLNTSWLGEVVDIEDPQKIGRVKIKVYGKFDELANEDIPWAYPGTINNAGSDSGGSSFSVPKLGAIVSVRFDQGNIYHPEYYFHQHLSKEAKAEIEGSYENAHIIVYDTVTEGSLKIFFTEEKGLVLDYKSSQINIRPDNTIYLEHSGGKAIHIQNDKISIGKEDESDEPAVLGEKNVDALKALADEIKALADAVSLYASSQATITSAIAIYAPLGAALTKLTADVAPVIAKIPTIKSTTIPKTRSSSVTVDGPSKS